MKNKFPPCPKCHRKGLHYSDHPHAYGWKNYDKVTCRFCDARFPVAHLTKHAPDVVESAASTSSFQPSEVSASEAESTPATTRVM